MSAFIVRRTYLPSLAELTAIEQIVLVDRTPQAAISGVQRGSLLVVGEFEDGAFNTPTEVYGSNDEQAKFGGFGYQYGSLVHQNPCARLHNSESWNGNGYIKGITAPRWRRKVCCRVNTSVGTERVSIAAGMRTTPQTWSLQAADQLSVTTDSGGPVNGTAITATAATIAGGALGAGLATGDQTSIAVDGLPAVIVTFQATDVTEALIAARVNSFMGYTACTSTAPGVDFFSAQLGSGARLILTEVTAGVLAKLGHVAGTWNGGGSVANLAAVTATEIAAHINIGGIAAIFGYAAVDANTGQVVIYRGASTTGWVQVADVAGALATDLGLTTGAPGRVTANIGAAFTVPAGTRVRNVGGEEWVTMRTLTWPEGTVAAPNTGYQDVEIRPHNETVAHSAAGGGTVTYEVDLPSVRMIEVTNPANLTAGPLSEAAIDALYQTAFDRTKNILSDARIVTESLCARSSTNTKRMGRQNAIDASDEGCYGRTFYVHGQIGWTQVQAIADRPLYAGERVDYSWPNWRMYVPEIAAVGVAGGTGFTADGIVNIGSDGPLASLHCALNPEENIGQANPYLGFLTGFDTTITATVQSTLTKVAYIALKAAGICAPRIDQNGALCYQSEVTSDLTPGRTTQKRRKMADMIQDTLGVFGLDYSKKMATDARRAGMLAAIQGFLQGLLSPQDPNSQRIKAFSVLDVTDADPDRASLGIVQFQVKVQLLSSMDVIVFDTEIGEGVDAVLEA